MYAARLQAVEKSFGNQRAVEALDLAIPAGETCGLIGPSGAGKSTTIRIIMSILFPDAGQVEVLLPAPLGPINPQVSPAGTARSSAWTARWVPKLFSTACSLAAYTLPLLISPPCPRG